jgi:hypothetical protein
MNRYAFEGSLEGSNRCTHSTQDHDILHVILTL